MAKFIIRNRINSVLKNTAKPPIIEIEFLGTGGAFDFKEGNSSMLIKTVNGDILIDCGSLVYSELMRMEKQPNIKYIFITHMHEDHIGSLSTFSYYKKYQMGQNVFIECNENMEGDLKNYLDNVCKMPKGSYVINNNKSDVYTDLNMRVFKIDTTGNHFEGLHTSGFVFQFRKSNEDIFIVFSGDINIPITEVIEKNHNGLYNKMLEKKENVFMFHEATAREFPLYYPHCDFLKLIKVAETFPNIYTYHHSKEETKLIMGDFQDKQIRLKKTLDSLEKELGTKLEKIGDNEVLREGLLEQYSNAKAMVNDSFDGIGSTAFIYDVNQTGKNLVIQEENNF